MTEVIYTAELDFTGVEVKDAFFDWYAYRHAPDLMAAGFLSAASYELASSPTQIVDINLLAGLDALKTEAYKRVGPADPRLAGILASVASRTYTTYLVELIADADATAPAHLSDILMVRFDWSQTGPVPWSELLGRVDGLSGSPIYCGRRSAEQPAICDDGPEFIVLVEVDSDIDVPGLIAAITASLAGDASSVDVAHGRCRYPWPNRQPA